MSQSLKWTQVRKCLHTAGPNVSVEKEPCGWGKTFNPNNDRLWAARVDGDLLKTKAGSVRVFGTSQSAKCAAEDAVMARA